MNGNFKLLQYLHLGSRTYGNTDMQEICATKKRQFHIKILRRKLLKHNVSAYCGSLPVVVTAGVSCTSVTTNIPLNEKWRSTRNMEFKEEPPILTIILIRAKIFLS